MNAPTPAPAAGTAIDGSRNPLRRRHSAAGLLVLCAGLAAFAGCGSSPSSSAPATVSAATSSAVSGGASGSPASVGSAGALPSLQPDARKAAQLVQVPGVTFENFKFPPSLGDLSGSEAQDKQALAMGIRTVNYAGSNSSQVLPVAVTKGQDAADVDRALRPLKGTNSYRNATIVCGTTGALSTCISRFGAASFVSLVAATMTPDQAAAYMADLLDAQE